MILKCMCFVSSNFSQKDKFSKTKVISSNCFGHADLEKDTFRHAHFFRGDFGIKSNANEWTLYLWAPEDVLFINSSIKSLSLYG